jgi:hypothetical protein
LVTLLGFLAVLKIVDYAFDGIKLVNDVIDEISDIAQVFDPSGLFAWLKALWGSGSGAFAIAWDVFEFCIPYL